MGGLLGHRKLQRPGERPLWVKETSWPYGRMAARCPLYPRKRTLVSTSATFLALQVDPWMPRIALTSNKIIQKGLASSHRQSGTVPSSGRWLRFGILPRRLLRRGGASVVAAMVAAQPKEIPMTKAKSKRKPASPANDSKSKTRNSVKRTAADKTGQLKPVTEPATYQQPRPHRSRLHVTKAKRLTSLQCCERQVA